MNYKSRIEKVERALNMGKPWLSFVILEEDDGTKRCGINGRYEVMSDEEIEKRIANLNEHYRLIVVRVGSYKFGSDEHGRVEES